MITMQEVEMLAQLVGRAGVNPYEAAWANTFLDRLRALVATSPEPPAEETPPGNGPVPQGPMF